MIEATLIDGNSAMGGEPPVVELVRGGKRAVRWYWINCVDPVKAATAANLPEDNEPWSADEPGLRVVARTIRYRGGIENGATEEGGVCLAQVRYETPLLTGQLPPPLVKQAWTEIVPGVTTITAHFDVDENGDPDNPEPIANGRGAPREVGTLEAHVHVIVSQSQVNLAAMAQLALQQAVNKGEVKLPPIIGSTQTFDLEPGQVQYKSSHVVQTRGGLVELVHILHLRPDFLFRWQKVDEFGNATGPVIESRLYPEADLAAFLPGLDGDIVVFGVSVGGGG